MYGLVVKICTTVKEAVSTWEVNFRCSGGIVGIWLVVNIVGFAACVAVAQKKKKDVKRIAFLYAQHKLGMLFVLFVAATLDLVASVCDSYIKALGFTWHSTILIAAMLWYVFLDLCDILWCAKKLGASVPDWLAKLVKSMKRYLDELDDESDVENKS